MAVIVAASVEALVETLVAKRRQSVEHIRRILIIGALIAWLAGCGDQPRQESESPPPTDRQSQSALEEGQPRTKGTELSPARMAQWSKNCALCHVRGEGGAPVLGDSEAWAARFAKGDDILLQNTVEGINNMPPLGYCMDCEEEDFQALIQFFSDSSRGAQSSSGAQPRRGSAQLEGEEA